MTRSIADLRREYSREKLTKSSVDPDPLHQFEHWLQEAIQADLIEPTAMILATAGGDGMPSARAVLLKGFDERGFVFFTNYASRKGMQLAENPRAAVCFLWKELERQVRIEGRVEKTSQEESVNYFHSRPRGSRIGALASHQSKVVENRQLLEERFRALDQRFAGDDVPLPDHWGGYRLNPTLIEFWQGRPNRLHDRICYRRRPDGGWIIQRLEP